MNVQNCSEWVREKVVSCDGWNISTNLLLRATILTPRSTYTLTHTRYSHFIFIAIVLDMHCMLSNVRKTCFFCIFSTHSVGADFSSSQFQGALLFIFLMHLFLFIFSLPHPLNEKCRYMLEKITEIEVDLRTWVVCVWVYDIMYFVYTWAAARIWAKKNKNDRRKLYKIILIFFVRPKNALKITIWHSTDESECEKWKGKWGTF
jgi:hypothetical protein